ncbi:facilitated trehalose transporter Tret1-like [Lycorma delicatula]|uniref:facilitated trehalose transporter Tret1-like n=1 Tax=Lycorma delicatula TaxID=130591 RepID=UPI003F518E35
MSPASMAQLESLREEQSQPIVTRHEENEKDGNQTDDCDNNGDCSITVFPHIIPYQINNANCSNSSVIQTLSGSHKEDIHKSQLHKKSARKAFISQCMVNAVVMTIVTASGMPIGYSAILLPQLQSPNSTLPTDDSWASWIASVHSTAAPMGSILAGPMMDRLGRRTTLQLSLIPIIAGWTFMSLAPNHIVLVIGRLLAGFAVGMIPGPSQVLISEISEPKLRGLFSSMTSASYALGILLVYAAGRSLHWRVVAGVGTVLPILAIFTLFFLPESPVWLVNKDRPKEAKKCLLLLRGGNELKVQNELHTLVGHSKMVKDKEMAAKLGIEDTTLCAPVPHWWEIMTQPQVFKPFFIILTFCLLQILSGSYVTIFYGVTLISSASHTSSHEYDCLTIAVMTALVRFIVSIITSMCLLKLGRRKIGICSGLGTTLACLSLVIFLYSKSFATGADALPNDRDTKIIAGLIMIYVATNTFGIFSLPVMMIGEVLPSSVRGSVSGILLMVINLMIFSTTKLYPSIAGILGPIGVFTVFTTVAIITTIYIYLFLPETRDRPLTQIEEYFAVGKNYIWGNRDRDLMKRRRHSIM